MRARSRWVFSGSPKLQPGIAHKSGSYEDTYVASYEADHDITEAEADNLLATDYHMFPITGASYVMSDNRLVITYTVDHYN